MAKLEVIEMSEGLLKGMFAGVLPSTVIPKLEGQELKLTITESEFIEMATKGIDDRIKRAMTIKIKEGYIEITVRLM
jgi:hypothetical protein